MGRAILRYERWSILVTTNLPFDESESAPTISKLAEDDLALRRAVDDIIGNLLNDPEQSKV